MGEPIEARFRELKTLTTAVLAGLVATMLFNLLGSGTSAFELFIMPDWEIRFDAGEAAAVGFALGTLIIGVAGVAANITTVVLFCVWLHRASSNARALSTPHFYFTPAGAVVWWFVPIFSLFRPYQAVREILYKSAPEKTTTFTWIDRVPSLLGVWWAAWLITNILGNMSLRLGFSDDPAEQRTSLWIDVVDAPIHLFAGICACALVLSIQERQLARARELSALGAGPVT